MEADGAIIVGAVFLVLSILLLAASTAKIDNKETVMGIVMCVLSCAAGCCLMSAGVTKARISEEVSKQVQQVIPDSLETVSNTLELQ